MLGSRDLLTVLEQDERHAAMRLRVIRCEAQRRLILGPRAIQLAFLAKQIAQVEVAERIVGVTGDRFSVRGARGTAKSRRVEQPAKIVESPEVCRRPLYDLEVRATRFLGPREIREQTPALEVSAHIIRIRGQARVDFLQSLHAL
jgi:hypothetical protein